MYREQLVNLEDELARLREQDDLKNDDFKVNYFSFVANPGWFVISLYLFDYYYLIWSIFILYWFVISLYFSNLLMKQSADVCLC